MAEEEGLKREKCWDTFKLILEVAGLKPEEHKAQFEEEWELSMRYLPQDEAHDMAELIAKEVVKQAIPPPVVKVPKVVGPPPKVPVPPQGLDRLIWELNTGAITHKEYERRARELRK